MLAAVTAAVATGGCGTVYVGVDGPDPATAPLLCEQPAADASGMQVLLAQSVPTATAVPCLRSQVGDWIVTRFEVQDGRARIDFTYRYGHDDSATPELTPECQVGEAREVAGGIDGTRQYRREVRAPDRYADEIFYVYPGGCTSLRFHLSGSGAALRGGELASALGFVTRYQLDRQIRDASDGQLHLDPE